MCRNIKLLFNFDPPASDEEIYGASLQYVRKVTGFRQPSQANQEAFDRAVREVSGITRQLIDDLKTTATPRNREVEAAKAKSRAKKRYGSPSGVAK
jgi:hypothetical protein